MSDVGAFSAEIGPGERRLAGRLDKRLPLGMELMPDGSGFVTVETDRSDLLDTGEFEWALVHYGLDPELYEVDPDYPVEIGSWQMGYVDKDSGEAASRDLFRYKCKVRKRRAGNRHNVEHVIELCKRARKRKPLTAPPATGSVLVANIADLQTGKGDYGGTAALLERVNHAADNLIARIRNERPSAVILADLGDATEGCQGFYPDQTWSVDLNNTEQLRVATEIFVELLLNRIVGEVPAIHMVFVPSNHGEFRVGKGNTPTDRARDNADLIIADNVARVCAANPERYGHVHVWTPPRDGGDPFVCTLEIDGVMLAWTHGHQIAGGAGNRIKGIENWWQQHLWSDRGRPGTETAPTVADADILIVGHGHHLLMSQATGRLAIQCPAMENGSESFTTATGKRSSAGWLSFNVSPDLPALATGFQFL